MIKSRAGQSGFDSRKRREVFLFSKTPSPDVRLTQSPYLFTTEVSSLRRKRRGREAEHFLHHAPRLRMFGSVGLLRLCVLVTY